MTQRASPNETRGRKGPEVYTLGRSETDCDIVIAHESVSARHASVTDDGATLTLVDIGSTNGTFVRGTRLKPRGRVAIAPGEILEIGKVRGSLSRAGGHVVWTADATSLAGTASGPHDPKPVVLVDVRPPTALPTKTTALSTQLHGATEVRARIRELEQLVRNAEGTLRELENRGAWDRLWANNTRDLARAMTTVVRIQQYTIALFMAALQAHGRNMEMLAIIREEMHRLRATIEGVTAQVGDQAEIQLTMLTALEQVAVSIEQQMSLAQFEANALERERALEERVLRLEASARASGVAPMLAPNARGFGEEETPAAPPRDGSIGCLWIAMVIIAIAVVGIAFWVARTTSS